jgi:hypothetical membrane protein
MLMVSASTDRVTARLAEAALACFAIFAAGVALMHFLRPDYDVSSHMISEYAVGPWGGVMTTAIVGASLGCLMLALGLARSRPGSIAGWLAAALFAVASIGLAVTAVYPIDLPGAPPTSAGYIHEMSFLVNIASIVLAAMLTAVVAFQDARWRTHRVPAVVLALLLVVAIAVQFRSLHRGLPYGIPNRFVVLVMTTWFVVTAIRLRRLGR